MDSPEVILTKAREAKKLTQTELGLRVGLGLRAIQKLENGLFPKYKSDSIEAIDRELGTNLYELIYAQTGPATPSYTDKRRNLKNSDVAKDDLPVFMGNTRAGTITIYSDDPSQQEPVGHLSSKIFPGCNHAEKINGDSMYPLAVNQGLAIGKVIDKKGIVWGEKYIIHTVHGQAVLKYVHPSIEKGFIKIVSHNKKIPEQDIPLDDITFCVRVYFIVNPS